MSSAIWINPPNLVQIKPSPKIMWSADDHLYMTHALQLAQQGLYSTSPNPRVGCVLVKDGEIIGRGFHVQAGQAHAEVVALQQAQQLHPDKISGCTAYVTLEPCSHHGRTPPCADALIAAGVAQVVIAVQDANPLVAGNGIAKLQQAGINVSVGLMQKQAEQLNLGFFQRMRQQRPWVRVKIAASLDGKIALQDGSSQWISCEASRRDVQHWRARSCAILTGIGTVGHDNPRLNVRDIEAPRQPLKVVVDSQLRISPQAQLLQTGRSLIAYAQDPQHHAQQLASAGVELIQLPSAKSPQKIDLNALMHHLASLGINEVLVEAGATLNGALFEAKCVDELIIYQAPCLLGGNAKAMLNAPVLAQMSDSISLDWQDIRQIGDDLRIIARPRYHAID